jgi:hypothetical protein
MGTEEDYFLRMRSISQQDGCLVKQCLVDHFSAPER